MIPSWSYLHFVSPAGRRSRPESPNRHARLPAALLVVVLLFSADSFGNSRLAAVVKRDAGHSPRQITAEFTPRNCPTISDQAVVTAKVITADSGAPATQHPGVDVWVRDRGATYVIRVHFGDLGDGMNSCLSFNECPNTHELPAAYPVETARLKDLLDYLRRRGYCVGKFTSWGVPISPWVAHGSNCGDAFVEVVERFGIASEALPDMHQWLKEHKGGKWAFERGRRHPTDPFFAGE